MICDRVSYLSIVDLSLSTLIFLTLNWRWLMVDVQFHAKQTFLINHIQYDATYFPIAIINVEIWNNFIAITCIILRYFSICISECWFKWAGIAEWTSIRKSRSYTGNYMLFSLKMYTLIFSDRKKCR